MFKKIALALACASAMSMAQGATILLEEDFDNVSSLASAGWVFDNASMPPGPLPGWTQGNPGVFTAHQGASDAYIVSNFQAAAPNGVLNNQLYTPVFSVENGAIATFFLRAEEFMNFSDIVTYGYTDGAADPAGYIKQMTITVPTDGWTQYTITLPARGAGATARLGFIHWGPEANSNYVGLDTLLVLEPDEPTVVPEPASLMIIGLGLAGLGLARRGRRR